MIKRSLLLVFTVVLFAAHVPRPKHPKPHVPRIEVLNA